MILNLCLTEDDLKLVRFFNIEDNDDNYLKINKNVMLTIQSHILDDVAMVLGLRDKAIKGTSDDALGSAYPDNVEKYMLDTYNYVKKNIFLIETLLHQMVMEGVKPGHYKCKDNELIWKVTYLTDDFDYFKDENGNYDFTKYNGAITEPMREFLNDMNTRTQLEDVVIKVENDA